MKNTTTNTLHTCSYECDRPECVRAQRDYLRDRLEALTAVQRPDAGLDVEAVLRQFLTGDGYIAECDIQHIVAALTAQPAISGYTCTVPDDCETLHWRGQILSMNELASVAQPAADQFIATFRCETNGVVGTTTAKIHSVSRHDDGVIEVVIDHWPQQPAAGDGCHCGTCTCNPNMTPAVRFDLSPAQQEGAIREHLIRLGWTPPKRRPYNASGSLSEYGVFPECDTQPKGDK